MSVTLYVPWWAFIVVGCFAVAAIALFVLKRTFMLARKPKQPKGPWGELVMRRRSQPATGERRQ